MSGSKSTLTSVLMFGLGDDMLRVSAVRSTFSRAMFSTSRESISHTASTSHQTTRIPTVS